MTDHDRTPAIPQFRGSTPATARSRLTIVGGGVAGTALAAWLDPRRWDVTLIEQRPGLPDVGTAFAIWAPFLRLLDKHGLGSVVREGEVHLTDAVLADAADRVIAHGRGQDIWLVTRPALLGALDAAVPRTVARLTTRVADADVDGLPGDLVIAADGAHSAVRRAVWGDRPHRTGVWALRGVLGDGSYAQRPLREYWSRHGLVGVSRCPGGLTNWYATLHDPGPDAASGLAAARRRFAGHPDQVQGVLAAADPADTLLHEVIEARPTTCLHRGRYVLIGDAAHAMSPHLGRGACESLADAHALARALNAAGPAGAGRYQRQRLAPGQAARLGATVVRRLSEAGPVGQAVLRTLTRPDQDAVDGALGVCV